MASTDGGKILANAFTLAAGGAGSADPPPPVGDVPEPVTYLLTATGFGAMCGAVAFLYYPLATAWLGCTPASWYLKHDTLAQTLVRGRRRSSPATAERRDRLYLVKSAAEPERLSMTNESANLDSESLRRRSAIR